MMYYQTLNISNAHVFHHLFLLLRQRSFYGLHCTELIDQVKLERDKPVIPTETRPEMLKHAPFFHLTTIEELSDKTSDSTF